MTTLQIENLTIYKRNEMKGALKDEVLLAKGLTTTFESGKLNAIMGPNGAGKTTMLNALYGRSDRRTRTAGTILLDGKPRTPEEWYARASIVEQQPFFPPHTTLRRALNFAISLKNAEQGTSSKMEEFAEVLDNLLLGDKLDMDIDVFSGGEKQRAAIAVEFMFDKDILILDEPTSDLDSHLALNLITYLKELAQSRDKMIIFTIHQPSDQIVKMFDNILFISNGCALYNGKFAEIDTFLASQGIIRPADWTASDFLFEAFYNVSKKKVISDQRENITAFLEKVYAEGQRTVNSQTASNKSALYLQGQLNFRHILLLMSRSLRRHFITISFYLKILLNTGINIPFFFFLMDTLFDIYLRLPDNNELIIPRIGHPDYKAAQSVLNLVKNHYASVSTIIITKMMAPSQFFVPDDVALVEREISLYHYTPLTQIIATFLASLVISILLTCCYIVGAFGLSVHEKNIMLPVLMRLFMIPIVLGVIQITWTSIVSLLPWSERTKIHVKTMLVSFYIWLGDVCAVLIEYIPFPTKFITYVIRGCIAILSFGFPHSSLTTFVGRILQEKAQKLMDECPIYEERLTQLNADIKWYSETNLLASYFTSMRSALIIFLVSLTCCIVIPILASVYKHSGRVSLNP